MIQTIFSGVTAYISTSIDYLVVLLIVFSQVRSKRDYKLIYLGDLLGTTVLVSGALFLAFVLHFIPQDWILGLLGIIPIVFGLHLLLGEEGDNGELIETSLKKYNLTFSVAFITIATCGADNIGIYTPLFTAMEPSQIIPTLITFFFMMTLFFFLGLRLAKIPKIEKLLESYGRWISAAIYILLGLFILVEGGTISHFVHQPLRQFFFDISGAWTEKKG